MERIAQITKINSCSASFVWQSAPMSLQLQAEEHLRIIRSLMERALIYRAVSGPVALFCGLLALLVGAGGALWSVSHPVTMNEFMGVWIVVLLLTTGFHWGIIWKESKAQGVALISPNLRMALRAMIPALVCGAAFSFWFTTDLPFVRATICWMTFYGLSLLSTAHFAPRSIIFLGLTFVVAGVSLVAAPLLLLPCLPATWQLPSGSVGTHVPLAFLYMALTFGLFHLAYGVAIQWLRPKRSQE